MLPSQSPFVFCICSERRTKVIDDESDYYSSGSVWLSETERQKLKSQEDTERARKHASRRDARFVLDFAGLLDVLHIFCAILAITQVFFSYCLRTSDC